MCACICACGWKVCIHHVLLGIKLYETCISFSVQKTLRFNMTKRKHSIECANYKLSMHFWSWSLLLWTQGFFNPGRCLVGCLYPKNSANLVQFWSSVAKTILCITALDDLVHTNILLDPILPFNPCSCWQGWTLFTCTVSTMCCCCSYWIRNKGGRYWTKWSFITAFVAKWLNVGGGGDTDKKSQIFPQVCTLVPWPICGGKL